MSDQCCPNCGWSYRNDVSASVAAALEMAADLAGSNGGTEEYRTLRDGIAAGIRSLITAQQRDALAEHDKAVAKAACMKLLDDLFGGHEVLANGEDVCVGGDPDDCEFQAENEFARVDAERCIPATGAIAGHVEQAVAERTRELREALEHGRDLVASAYSHVSHGGPTRADAEKWLYEAARALLAGEGGKCA